MKALEVLDEELGIHGQPDDGVILSLTRKLDRVLDDLSGRGVRFHVLLVLRRREHLLEQRSELNLAPTAACLHVGKDFLKIPDTNGEVLHLAESAVDLLKTIGNLLEGFPKALLQGPLELLVNGAAHLLEAEGVVITELFELSLHGGADALELRVVSTSECRDGLGEGLQAIILGLSEEGQSVQE